MAKHISRFTNVFDMKKYAHRIFFFNSFLKTINIYIFVNTFRKF